MMCWFYCIHRRIYSCRSSFFFFNDTATTEIYTLSLHDALPILSACLCGINCKYSGENNLNSNALKLLKEGNAILVCPEQLGGLTTPRIPCEIMGGDGEDVLNGEAKVDRKSVV